MTAFCVPPTFAPIVAASEKLGASSLHLRSHRVALSYESVPQIHITFTPYKRNLNELAACWNESASKLQNETPCVEYVQKDILKRMQMSRLCDRLSLPCYPTDLRRLQMMILCDAAA